MLNFLLINKSISSLEMCNKENINDLFTKNGSAVAGLGVWEVFYCRGTGHQEVSSCILDSGGVSAAPSMCYNS